MEYTNAALTYQTVAEADVDTRATFLKRTYLHLLGAIGAFTAIEVYFFTSPVGAKLVQGLLSLPWLAILGGFILVAWLASHVAHVARSKPVQYLALAAFVVAEAIIFLPLLTYAAVAGKGLIESAAWVTIAGFIALTAIVFYTRKDFSFLRGILLWGGIVALGAIVASVIFNFELGVFFSIAMIAYAGGAIL